MGKLLNIDGIEEINDLLESFFQLTGYPVSIRDLEGNVLARSAWQPICEKFHRVHPEACKKCMESDTVLAGRVKSGEDFSIFQCVNGLADTVIPLIVDGVHVGNVYSGQFLLDEPDREYFTKQAETYGFDPKAYLAALDQVPVVSNEKIEALMDFLGKLARQICDLILQKNELNRLIESPGNTGEAARESENLFRKISDISTDYSYSHAFGEDGRVFLEWSFGAFERITGYKPEEMIAPDQIAKLIHPDDLADAGKRVEKILKGETVVSELRIVTRGGEIKWIRDKGVPEWDKAKRRVVRYIGTAREITEQKEAENELRKQRDLFELVINTAPTRIFWKDLNSVYLGGNQTFATDAGYESPSDIIGKNDDDMVWKEDADKYRADDRFVMRTGRPKTGYEEPFINSDGERVVWRTAKKPLKNLDGETIGVVAVSENITEEKAAAEKLADSESRLKGIIESSANLFYIHAKDHEVIYVSPQVREYLGYEPHEVMTGWDKFITDNPMNAAGIKYTEKALRTGERQPAYEVEMQRKDGEKIFVEVRETPIVENGEVVKIVGSLADITERKLAERELESANQQLQANKAQLLKYSHDLEERLKELRCIFNVSEILRSEKSNEEIFQFIADILPQSWQYTDNTAARVLFDGAEYTSPDFKKSKWMQAADIRVNNELRGKIEVYYIEERPESDEGPFLKEERELLTTLANICSEALERKQAADALKVSEEEYRILAESANHIIITHDFNGKITYANPYALEFINLPEERIIGADITKFVTGAEQKEQLLKRIKGFKKGERRVNHYELGLVLPDGTNRTLNVFGNPLKRKDGTDSVLIVGYDITEHKKAVEALRQSEERFRSYVENAPDGIFVVDENGAYLGVNPAASRITGYSREEILHMSISDMLQKDEIEKGIKHFQQVRNEGAAYDEIGFVTKAGENRFWEVSAVKLSDIRFLGFVKDITDRRQIQDQLETNDIRYRRAQEIGHVGNWEYNLQTGLFWGSEESKRIYGFSDMDADEFTTEAVEGCIPERERVHQALVDLIENETPYNLEFDIVAHGTRERKTIISIAELERDNAGNPLKVSGVIRDISRQKESEKFEKKQNEFIRFVLDNLPIGIATNEIGSMKATYMNRKFEEIYGWSWDEMPTFADYFRNVFPDAEYRKKMEQQIRADIQSGDADRMKWKDLRITTKSGEERSVYAFNIPFPDQNIMISTIQDFTDQRKAEKHLKESEAFNRSIVDNSKDCIAVLDLRGNLLFMNDGGLKAREIREIEPLLKKPWFDFWEGGVNQKAREAVNKAAQGELGYFEGSWTSRSGTSKWWSVQVSPIFDSGGKVGTILVVSRDITDTKQNEITIRENEKRMKLAADSAGFGIWDLDIVNNVLVWDAWMYKLYGISSDQFGNAYESWQAGLHPDDCERTSKEVEMAVSGEKVLDTEFRIVRPNGTIRFLKANAIVIRDANNQAVRMTGINYDITERKEAQEALEKHQRELESLVEQRTAEIVEKNAFLERMNDAMVDREFRIKELREEIEQLKRKKGTS